MDSAAVVLAEDRGRGPSRLLKNASVSRFVPLQRANRTESKTERIQAKMSFSAAC